MSARIAESCYEELFKQGDYEVIYNALLERGLMLTRNPVMGMIVYVHPYQFDHGGRAVADAIVARDVAALRTALVNFEGNLDDSVNVQQGLGFTLLVMAVLAQDMTMIDRFPVAAPSSPCSVQC